MGSLDDKEPFYAHFPKCGPLGAKWGRGADMPPPTPELTEKSPLLVGFTLAILKESCVAVGWDTTKL